VSAVPAPRGGRRLGRFELVRELGRGAQAVRDLEAVHARHADVEQHHLGLERGRELECAARIESGFHHVPVELQQQGQGLGGIAIVVDDQHPPRRRAGRPLARRLGRGDCDPRQADLEGAAGAGPAAGDADAPAMHLDQALDHRQADAEPALRAIQ